MRPCVECGRPANGTRCAQCARKLNRAKDARRRARGKGAAYNAREYRAYREWVKRTGPACWLCGALGADTVDHAVPIAQGGGNTRANWRPAHAGCNRRKGGRGA